MRAPRTSRCAGSASPPSTPSRPGDYEKVAEHGEQAVKTWRGEAAESIEDIAVAVEPRPSRSPAPRLEPVEVKDDKPPPPGTPR
ncbi:hypothetical protein GCM10023238_24200 [Streptomyces heliomycini]